MDSIADLRIAVLGTGAERAAWQAAIEGVLGLWPVGFDERPDAVVVPPGPDAYEEAIAALEGGAAVLVAAPGRLSSEQLGTLDRLAAVQGRLLHCYEPVLASPGAAFLRRLLAGEAPFWRPLSIEARRTGASSPDASLEATALEELALLDGLLGRPPSEVRAAMLPHAGTDVIELQLAYPGGLTALCSVAIDPTAAARRRLTVALQDRSIVLDERDCTSQVSVYGHGTAGEPSWSRCSIQPSAIQARRSELRSVAEALARGAAASNVGRWVRAAALWEAAQRSLESGAQVAVDGQPAQPKYAPRLRLIRGGRNEKAAPIAWGRPALRILAAG